MARRWIDPAVKAAAVRLRTRDRLGVRAIAARTGLSVSTVSLLLRDHPLSSAERQSRSQRGGASANARRWRGHIPGQKYGSPGRGSRAPRHTVVARYVIVGATACIRLETKTLYALAEGTPLPEHEHARVAHCVTGRDALHIVGLLVHRVNGVDCGIIGVTEGVVDDASTSPQLRQTGALRREPWMVRAITECAGVEPAGRPTWTKLSFGAFCFRTVSHEWAWDPMRRDSSFRGATLTALGQMAALLGAGAVNAPRTWPLV